jgi:hypothetical protein
LHGEFFEEHGYALHRFLAQRTLACCELEGIGDLIAEVSDEEGLVVVSGDLLFDVIGQAVEKY